MGVAELLLLSSAESEREREKEICLESGKLGGREKSKQRIWIEFKRNQERYDGSFNTSEENENILNMA